MSGAMTGATGPAEAAKRRGNMLFVVLAWYAISGLGTAVIWLGMGSGRIPRSTLLADMLWGPIAFGIAALHLTLLLVTGMYFGIECRGRISPMLLGCLCVVGWILCGVAATGMRIT